MFKYSGKDQVYEYEKGSGNSFDCPFCKDKEYTIEPIQKSYGEGKLDIFQKEKMGTNKIFIKCNGNEYLNKTNSVNVNIEEKENKKNVDSRIRTCAGKAQQISSLSP